MFLTTTQSMLSKNKVANMAQRNYVTLVQALSNMALKKYMNRVPIVEETG